MAEIGETTMMGYGYGDIRRMEAEVRHYRFALQTIAHGTFGRPAPTRVHEAKTVALKALVRGVSDVS